MSKKKDGIRVEFVGENSMGVTGSCIYIETPTKKMLLECGLYQSNNVKRDYEINSRKFKFKVKELDYIFVNHIHQDHLGLIGKLYKEGCKAQIIVTDKSVPFIEVMAKDSAYIMGKDAATLSKTTGRDIQPLYTEEDVNIMLDYIVGYEMNRLYMLDEDISFKFISAGHIIGSAQLILYIKDKKGHIQKILYTSDIGGSKLNKPFVEPFEKETKTGILIGECTYGSSDKREVKKKDIDKDIEKIRTVVLETIDRGGSVLIPCFSLDRTQYMLSILYKMFANDKSFDIPIVVDSPLSCKITKIYQEILEGEDKELIDNICNWENVRFISDRDESMASVADKRSRILISSSGMLHAGRVLNYVKNILPDSKSTILFVGYSAQNTLATKIKNGSSQKSITIDGKPYKNRCSIIDLRSFSGHRQRNELLSYYKEVQCNNIYLIHGDTQGRIEFKKDLEALLSKENKTTKVIVPTKNSVIHL